jgi:hypothetical protein
MSRAIIESYSSKSQSAPHPGPKVQHFSFTKPLNCGRERRNFRVMRTVSHIKQANAGRFSLILLVFAFHRQLLRKARHLLET